MSVIDGDGRLVPIDGHVGDGRAGHAVSVVPGPSSGSGPSSPGGIVIQEGGSTVGTATTLNFFGANLQLIESSPGVFAIRFLPGSGGGGGTLSYASQVIPQVEMIEGWAPGQGLEPGWLSDSAGTLIFVTLTDSTEADVLRSLGGGAWENVTEEWFVANAADSAAYPAGVTPTSALVLAMQDRSPEGEPAAWRLWAASRFGEGETFTREFVPVDQITDSGGGGCEFLAVQYTVTGNIVVTDLAPAEFGDYYVLLAHQDDASENGVYYVGKFSPELTKVATPEIGTLILSQLGLVDAEWVPTSDAGWGVAAPVGAPVFAWRSTGDHSDLTGAAVGDYLITGIPGSGGVGPVGPEGAVQVRNGDDLDGDDEFVVDRTVPSAPQVRVGAAYDGQVDAQQVVVSRDNFDNRYTLAGDGAEGVAPWALGDWTWDPDSGTIRMDVATPGATPAVLSLPDVALTAGVDHRAFIYAVVTAGQLTATFSLFGEFYSWYMTSTGYEESVDPLRGDWANGDPVMVLQPSDDFEGYVTQVIIDEMFDPVAPFAVVGKSGNVLFLIDQEGRVDSQFRARQGATIEGGLNVTGAFQLGNGNGLGALSVAEGTAQIDLGADGTSVRRIVSRWDGVSAKALELYTETGYFQYHGLRIDSSGEWSIVTPSTSDVGEDGQALLSGGTGASPRWGDIVATSDVGAAGGVAELDESGLVPSSQLPGFVDDVIVVSTFGALPGTGEAGKIYVTEDTNQQYRWSGVAYVVIGTSLALGETSGSAYRGDHGKTAYDHSQSTGNPHGTAIGDISGLQTALDAKAPTASPNFTGTPTAPTPSAGDNSTKVATTAYVQGEVADRIPADTIQAPGDLIVGVAGGLAAMSTSGTNGRVLTEDSTQPEGMKWAASPSTSKPGRTIMAASRWNGSGSFIGTVLGPGGDNNRLGTMAVTAGHQIFWHGVHTGQTITAMYISVSATSLSAGQAVQIACYAEAADGGPGARQWVQSITVGTSTGAVGATGLSLAMPNGKCWISFLNPSENAGSVTVRRCDFTESEIFTPAGSTIAFQHMTGISTSSSDLTSTKFSVSASSTVIGANTYSTFPLIGVQA